MKWFKHDTDASIDAKLQELLLDYGASGYGLYWYCVELIAQNVNENNITFELEHDARIIARNLNLTVKETENMMKKMIELDLFSISKNDKLACYTLAKRIDQSMTSSPAFRGLIRNFKESHDEVMICHDKVMQEEKRREEKRREENIQEKKKSSFEIFLKTIEDLFEANKILTHSAKINKTDKTKKYFKLLNQDNLLNVANDYTRYVTRNKGKSVRLDKYLIASYENNLDAIEYGVENNNSATQKTKQQQILDEMFPEENQDAIDAEVV